jgi:hypothetical protein
LEVGSEQLQENNNENRLTVRSQKKAIESVWKRRPAVEKKRRLKSWKLEQN